MMAQCRDCKNYHGPPGKSGKDGHCALTMVKVDIYDKCEKFLICEGQRT
jgi:hypothetical protein